MPASPTAVLMTIGKNAIKNAISTFGSRPKPNQTRSSGATATFGMACDETRSGSTAREKAVVLSFVIDGVHPHDAGTILDREGVAVRAGHHCAQPVMDRFGVSATTRASLAFYNTREDIDALVAGIQKVKEVFAV